MDQVFEYILLAFGSLKDLVVGLLDGGLDAIQTLHLGLLHSLTVRNATKEREVRISTPLTISANRVYLFNLAERHG